MNYNYPNQGPRGPFPPQYGPSGSAPPPPQSGPYYQGAGYPPQPPNPGAGYPPQPPVSSAGYPSLAGLGQPQYGGPSSYPAPSGYSSQPPYGGPGGPSMGYPQPSSYQQEYRPSYNAPFDERAYLQKIFNEIDSNHDGRITGQELHEALRRGQPTSEFDPYTIQTLVEKYDSDRDNQINFQEFNNLFTLLNTQLNEFFDFDSDNSGSIDGRELGNILRRKGYQFSPDLFNYIVYEISRRSGKPGVTFDTYVRVIARFDFLRDQYNRNPQIKNSVPLEKYIRDTFF